MMIDPEFHTTCIQKIIAAEIDVLLHNLEISFQVPREGMEWVQQKALDQNKKDLEVIRELKKAILN